MYGAQCSSPTIPDFQDNQHCVLTGAQHRLGNMGVTLLESRLCLLLLLGLVIMVVSFRPPPGLTPSQWFEIQHVNNRTTLLCTPAMLVVNRYTGRCKGQNTFLNTTFAAVAGVCARRSTNCTRGPGTNCHNSSAPVSLTYCNLTSRGSHYTQCRYQTSPATMFYRVACNNRTPQDNGSYPVVPVHLDDIF
ncbi:eosinophil cationic protein-like [Mesocricetus auratus]|uniref:Ribonuclease pancreatic n=1 Tax=Mesocricetus auratus TaxID=10036 RepID=A0A1U7REH9_MESAU|nr:eosinophil cationic protein [Mesocricetus auratus]XP_040592642.1 eosinophil cationic protein-like [Mesocricetus auratus]